MASMCKCVITAVVGVKKRKRIGWSNALGKRMAFEMSHSTWSVESYQGVDTDPGVWTWKCVKLISLI
jgi:hypothetical protein